MHGKVHGSIPSSAVSNVPVKGREWGNRGNLGTEKDRKSRRMARMWRRPSAASGRLIHLRTSLTNRSRPSAPGWGG